MTTTQSHIQRREFTEFWDQEPALNRVETRSRELVLLDERITKADRTLRAVEEQLRERRAAKRKCNKEIVQREAYRDAVELEIRKLELAYQRRAKRLGPLRSRDLTLALFRRLRDDAYKGWNGTVRLAHDSNATSKGCGIYLLLRRWRGRLGVARVGQSTNILSRLKQHDELPWDYAILIPVDPADLDIAESWMIVRFPAELQSKQETNGCYGRVRKLKTQSFQRLVGRYPMIFARGRRSARQRLSESCPYLHSARSERAAGGAA